MSSKETQNNRSTGPNLAFLTAAVVAGALVRLLLLGSKSLWLDEMQTILMAKGGLTTIVEGSGMRFVHPPLYFRLMDYWMALGQSEVVLRMPSALFGTLAILMAYLLAKELFGARIGLTAAWLVAVAPALVWYSQEARSYSFLIFLTLVSTLSFVKLFKKPNVRWWLLFMVATTAAIYTHYMAFLLPLIQVVLALALSLYDKPVVGQIGATVLAWIAVLLAYLPWSRTPAARRFAGLFGGNQRFTVGGFQLPLDRPVYQLLLIGGAFILVGLSIVYIVLAPRAGKVRQLAISLRQKKIFQGVLIFFFLVLLALSVVPRGYSVKRQLLLLLPFVLIGYAWFWPWARQQRPLIAALIALSLLASLINIIAIPKAQWRETAQYVDQHSQAADAVLLTPTWLDSNFEYYSQAALTIKEVTPAEVPDRLPEIASVTDRIWLITHQRDSGGPYAVIGRWLDQHGTLLDEVYYHNIRISLYEVGQDEDG